MSIKNIVGITIGVLLVARGVYAAELQRILVYSSSNLSGHEVFAECNPGGGTSCPCSPSDVAMSQTKTFGTVTANPNNGNTWVNAIGNKTFQEQLPNNKPIDLSVYKYIVETRLPVLPRANTNQKKNPQGAHTMIQLYDGRNALWQADKHTLEAVIYWELSPFTSEYGKIKIFTDPPYTLIDTGMKITPDLRWHKFELTADFKKQEYRSITIDGKTKNLFGTKLISVNQPTWGEEVTLALTTESLPAWPWQECTYIFNWSQEFRNILFYKLLF